LEPNICLHYHLEGASTHEGEFDTSIYELRWIIKKI
jgi:hypothetical protein